MPMQLEIMTMTKLSNANTIRDNDNDKIVKCQCN